MEMEMERDVSFDHTIDKIITVTRTTFKIGRPYLRLLGAQGLKGVKKSSDLFQCQPRKSHYSQFVYWKCRTTSHPANKIHLLGQEKYRGKKKFSPFDFLSLIISLLNEITTTKIALQISKLTIALSTDRVTLIFIFLFFYFFITILRKDPLQFKVTY